MTKPRTTFDWAIYADATFAGLTPLIPLPLVDLAFEWVFRRRISRAIVRRRKRLLLKDVFRELNRSHQGWLEGCVLLPFKTVFELLKRLSRKLLYFLSINEAADKVSYYWHYAFLLDYALLSGYLEEAESARTARLALERQLRTTTTSPLARLAKQITTGTPHVFRTLRGARRGEEDEVIQEKKSLMECTWQSFADYFEELAVQYDQTYKEVQARQLARET